MPLPDGLRPRLLTSEQAAVYLAMSEGRLRNLRSEGNAPPNIIVGRNSIRYTVQDLDEWIENRRKEAGIGVAVQVQRGRPRKTASFKFVVEDFYKIKSRVFAGAIALATVPKRTLIQIQITYRKRPNIAVILLLLLVVLALSFFIK